MATRCPPLICCATHTCRSRDEFGRYDVDTAEEVVIPNPLSTDFQLHPAGADPVTFSAIFRSWLVGEAQLRSYVDSCNATLCNPTCPLSVGAFVDKKHLEPGTTAALVIATVLLLVPTVIFVFLVARGSVQSRLTSQAVHTLRRTRKGLSIRPLGKDEQISVVFQRIEYWTGGKLGAGTADMVEEGTVTSDGSLPIQMAVKGPKPSPLVNGQILPVDCEIL